MNALLLCVGGPLHGLRRAAGVPVLAHTTFGPPPIRFVSHYYDLDWNKNCWRWRMVPRWPVAGFVKPKR